MAIAWPGKAISSFHPAASNNSRQSQGVAWKVSYLFLQQIDLVLTLFAMHLGIPEMNPLMKTLLASPLQLWAIKFVIPLFIVWLVPGKLLIPALVLLAVVVGWDVKELMLILL